MEIRTFSVLGVNVAITDVDQTCQQIETWVKTKQKTYVCLAPVSTIVACQSEPKYKDVVNQSGMTTPDGMPLVWLGRKVSNEIKRTYGPDVLLELCRRGQKNGLRHYFYGGTKETLSSLTLRLKSLFEEIQIVGCYSPDYLADARMEKDGIVQQINAAQADILWVGLGSPKQDYWMNMHRDVLNVPVMMGVGAAFDFIAGTKRQAPKWMRKNGLEWLFRLCCEPRRLWKRYLVGNVSFVYYLIKQKLVS